MYDDIENGQCAQSKHCQDTAGDRCTESGLQRDVHLPNPPELAPLDITYFLQLKKHLRGKRFEDREDVCDATVQPNGSKIRFQNW